MNEKKNNPDEQKSLVGLTPQKNWIQLVYNQKEEPFQPVESNSWVMLNSIQRKRC